VLGELRYPRVKPLKTRSDVSPVNVPTELLPEKTKFEQLPLDKVEAAVSRHATEIWSALRGSKRFPSRGDLNPRQFAGIMPHMSLVKVVNHGEDFENRFVGDAVVRAHDVEIVHRSFSDIAVDMPELMSHLFALFRDVVRSGEPLAYRGITGHDLRHVRYTDSEGVLLPLGETDGFVDHVAFVGTCSVKIGSTVDHPADRAVPGQTASEIMDRSNAKALNK